MTDLRLNDQLAHVLAWILIGGTALVLVVGLVLVPALEWWTEQRRNRRRWWR